MLNSRQTGGTVGRLHPADLAAAVAVTTVRAALREHAGLREVIFCCFADRDLAIYERLLQSPPA